MLTASRAGPDCQPHSGQLTSLLEEVVGRGEQQLMQKRAGREGWTCKVGVALSSKEPSAEKPDMLAEAGRREDHLDSMISQGGIMHILS